MNIRIAPSALATLVAMAITFGAAPASGADKAASAAKPPTPPTTTSAPAAKAAATPAATTATAPSSATPILPGIVGKDTKPNGCVSCHTGQHTLNKDLAAAKHKNVDAKTKVVPTDCKSCHKADGDIDSLAQMAHLVHYADGEKSEFVREYGGQCLHCHAIDLKTGDAKVKSGAKNW